MSKIQSIRGMNDILPADTPLWQVIEARMGDLMARYAYREIRMPVLEPTELFKRSIGEVTDIVEKEMYTFDDRNGDSLTLRPEGTAGCVRAAEQHGLLFNQQQRLWYRGPMFRHERPQKGRLRQFHQFGVEAFGLQGPDIDAELIAISARFWQELGISEHLTLELNSIGTSDERQAFRQALLDYLTPLEQQLDEDSQRRLGSNPLRILDSKSESTRALLQDAPALQDFLGEQSREHFDGLCRRLDAMGIAYKINPQLVRGLDYYGLTVFEWTTEKLGAQGTVCAGGRYDGLVEQLGGKAVPAVGFAMGIERLCLLLEACDALPELPAEADVYIVASGEEASLSAQMLAEERRSHNTGWRVVCNAGGGGFKAQFKRADRSGAALAVIIGEAELAEGRVNLKWLRDADKEQQSIAREQLCGCLDDYLS